MTCIGSLSVEKRPKWGKGRKRRALGGGYNNPGKMGLDLDQGDGRGGGEK